MIWLFSVSPKGTYLLTVLPFKSNAVLELYLSYILTVFYIIMILTGENLFVLRV